MLAVVGGGMAFRASNPIGLRLYYQAISQPNCTAPTILDTVVLDPLGTVMLPCYTTTIAGPCPGVIVRVAM